MLYIFNDFIDSDIDQNSVKLLFFTKVDAVQKYEEMCRDFPQYLSEPYMAEGFFTDVAASAFVNGDRYGILIASDIALPPKEIIMTFFHEIAHLFCTRNEVPGEAFFEKYCSGTGTLDGMINAGYAIWREAIADITADAAMTLADVHDEVMRHYTTLSFANPASKRAMSLIIAYIMISKGIASTEDWSDAEAAILGHFQFDDSCVIKILELVFCKLHKQPFWEITPDFITELGDLYLWIISDKGLRHLPGSYESGLISDKSRMRERYSETEQLIDNRKIAASRLFAGSPIVYI